MGEPRISQFPEPSGGGGGGGGDSFWTYDGSTLQPDPATTTPLEHFIANSNTDSSVRVTADPSFDFSSGLYSLVDAGTFLSRTFLVSLADSQSRVAQITTSAYDDASGATSVSALATNGATSGNLTLDGDGSFSLTADDGTTTGVAYGGTGGSAISATDNGTGNNSGLTVGASSDGASALLAVIGTGAQVTTFTAGCSDSGNLVTMSMESVGDGSDLSAVDVLASDTSSVVRFRGVADGAPDDALLDASTFALWLDDTIGTTILNIKAKDSGGTVRTAAIPLL